MKIMIAIPALNEAETIGQAIAHLPQKIEGISEIMILVVDDGSTDKTAKIAKESGALVLSHGKNRGVGAAFQSAVEKSLREKVDILCTIDADGQFDANEIPKMITPILEKKADFVTGNRFSEKIRPKNMPPLKFWGNQKMSRLISALAGQNITDSACGFRAYSREALLNLNLLGSFTYTQETILDLCAKNFRLAEIPISVQYFPDRQSRVAGNLFRYAKNSLRIIVKSYRDYHPFRFFGFAGILLFFLGCLADAFLIGHYFLIGGFSPYKFVGVIGIFLNLFGILLIVIGIAADILGRIRRNQEQILYFLKKQEYEK